MDGWMMMKGRQSQGRLLVAAAALKRAGGLVALRDSICACMNARVECLSCTCSRPFFFFFFSFSSFFLSFSLSFSLSLVSVFKHSTTPTDEPGPRPQSASSHCRGRRRRLQLLLHNLRYGQNDLHRRHGRKAAPRSLPSEAAEVVEGLGHRNTAGLPARLGLDRDHDLWWLLQQRLCSRDPRQVMLQKIPSLHPPILGTMHPSCTRHSKHPMKLNAMNNRN